MCTFDKHTFVCIKTIPEPCLALRHWVNMKKPQTILNLVDFSRQGHFSNLEKSYCGRHAYMYVCMLLRVKCKVYAVKDAVSAVLLSIYSWMVNLKFLKWKGRELCVICRFLFYFTLN